MTFKCTPNLTTPVINSYHSLEQTVQEIQTFDTCCQVYLQKDYATLWSFSSLETVGKTVVGKCSEPL